MEVLTRIVELREKKGWSLYQLASKAGLTYKTLYNWYNGETVPTLKALEAVAEALEIPLYSLFTTDRVYIANDELQELLQKWEKLDQKQKAAVMNVIDSYQ